MTLNTDMKNWLATNAGSAGCFASSGVAYTDPDGIARTGSTGDVANAFLVAHLVGKDAAIIIASTNYSTLKTINSNADLSVDDISWIYNNSYCAVSGSPTPTPAPRTRVYPPSGGLKFNGPTTYVNAGNNSSTNITGEITLEAWININQIPTITQIYAGIAVKGSDTYFFALNQDKLSLLIGKPDSSGWNVVCIGSTTLRAGTWYNVAATYSPATGKAVLYINGTIDKSCTGAPGNIGSKTAWLSIGSADSYNSAYPFMGIIAEIREYSRALSQSEIANNMTGNITRTGLVLEHLYRDGNARDTSGNGNDGTIINAVFQFPTQAPTATPSPTSGFIGAFQFQSAPELPQIALDLSGVTLQQSTSRDLHLMINQVKITNITPLNIYIATEVRLFPGSQTSCPASGQDFQGMDRTSTKNARIVLLSPGETATMNMDFYQHNIVGLHSICLYIHGSYVRADLEAEILPITG